MDESVFQLVNAMAQLLDDMGPDGLCVCPAAKAWARITLEPFINPDDDAGLISLKAAMEIVIRAGNSDDGGEKSCR